MIHFHTDSYPMTVKRVSCDKEIGHYSRGWHTCKRKAIVRVESKVSHGLYLDYCRQHAPASIQRTLSR